MAEAPMITLGSILEKRANDLILAIRKNLEENDSIATRKLIQSIHPRIKIFGNVFSMELLMEDYWKFVEDGRKPGKQPPLESIMKWITDKGINLGAFSTRRKKTIKALKNKTIRKGFRQRSKDSLRKSLAFLIARKIGKRGIKPTHFLSKVVNETWVTQLKEDIGKALKKDYTIQIIQAAK